MLQEYIVLQDETGKTQNFEVKTVTMAVAEVVIPLLNELDKIQNIDTTEFDGLSIEGNNISDMGKMLKFKEMQTKTLNSEQLKQFFEISVKIVQNIVKYTPQTEKHWKAKVEGLPDTEFWKSQSLQQVKDNVTFFRQISKLGIYNN